VTQDLRQHLWNCAEILRGSAVYRTDWKAYILPLLFFKRISDVWDEETADAAALFGDVDPVDFPKVHRFSVPEGCHWRDIRETPANMGAALSRAMRDIERANPETLYRVFGAADWGNREMLTDEILKDLLEALSAMSLGNKAVGTDVLGDAYEYLIGRFADVTKRKKAGEFCTPRSVARMMVELLGPEGRREHLRPGVRHGRHAARCDRTRAARRRRRQGQTAYLRRYGPCRGEGAPPGDELTF
jgi:type I restriction enzyme M protein